MNSNAEGDNLSSPHGGDETLSESQNKTDLSLFIAENFGANATYVEGLLNRFRNDPQLVDESWRTYFNELLGGDGPAAQTQESAPSATSSQAGGNGAAAPPSATTATGRGAASAPAAG